jgi:hypothetical protein
VGGHEAVVRDDASGSMPAMTMTFALAPAANGPHMHAGQTIDADVDGTTRPPTLRNIQIFGEQALTSGTAADELPKSAIRNVTPLAVGDAVPQTPFVDEHGAPFTFASLRGEEVVAAFIYTRCPDECPLISAKFARMQSLLRGAKVHLVEVSLDPSFDTPAVLTRYAHTFGADRSAGRC